MVYWIVADRERATGSSTAAGSERFGPYPTRDEAQAALRRLLQVHRSSPAVLRVVLDPS